ncbi:MAG TPA: ABC transporter permease, partial [Vicinamibacterales bacterium]|nr:ABC transporter permease [Vicinamibacterales bacterium]
MPQSLRFALRRWRTRPGLAIVAIVILAIGIGTTTAMFSLVNAVLLTEEPWPHADRLVRIFAVQPQQRNSPAFAATWNRGDLGWASWRDVQRAPFVADAAAWLPDQQIVGDNQTELVQAMYASSTLPSLLGARPEAGRFFTAEEDEADSGTVIISHRLWARLFGSDPDVVGKVTLVTRPGSPAAAASRRAIVGVLPAGLVFPGDEPDILLPIGVHKYNGSFAPNRFLKVIARLEADADVGAVASAVEPLVRREEPAERRTSRVVTLREDRVGIGDASLWLMFAGAALLLVVACSNVAGLLLSDARSRRHETAVRLALGGSRFAILRALMVEHGVLAIVAAVAGVLLASWLIPVLSALAPAGLIGDQAVRLDPRIAGWAIAASIVTTLVAGLVPATTISSARPTDSLKGGARELTRGSRWRHRSIVAAQFGLALVLLVGAGLFGETLIRLGRRPLGFSPEGVVIVGVSQTRPGPAPPISPEERERLRQDYYAVRRDGDIVALNRLLYGPVW